MLHSCSLVIKSPQMEFAPLSENSALDNMKLASKGLAFSRLALETGHLYEPPVYATHPTRHVLWTNPKSSLHCKSLCNLSAPIGSILSSCQTVSSCSKHAPIIKTPLALGRGRPYFLFVRYSINCNFPAVNKFPHVLVCNFHHMAFFILYSSRGETYPSIGYCKEFTFAALF